jgi:hypothetical protein
MWISKQEYDESGPSIVHRKCFWGAKSSTRFLIYFTIPIYMYKQLNSIRWLSNR